MRKSARGERGNANNRWLLVFDLGDNFGRQSIGGGDFSLANVGVEQSLEHGQGNFVGGVARRARQNVNPVRRANIPIRHFG